MGQWRWTRRDGAPTVSAMRLPVTLVLLLAARAAAAPCQLVPSGYGEVGSVAVRAEVVVNGLEVPWGLAFLPGGDLLVSERPGRVRLVRAGKLVADPVLKLEVSGRGEGGLMGLALHPDFERNRLFYLYYTSSGWLHPVNRVARYRLADDGTRAVLDRVIVDDIPAAMYHDGGRLRFGPDGMLYIGTGDGRTPERAQDVASPNGKILRLTPDGAIPADNPWPGKPAFVVGVRNCEAFDWYDAKTLVIADHGPSGEMPGRTGHDEIDVVHAGDNLGWPTIFSCETRAGMVTPSLTFEQSAPPGGAAFYRGDAIAAWKGSLLVGTLASRHLHRVVLDPADVTRVARHEVYFAGDPPHGLGRLREVIMGPDGQLYVTTSNCDGRGHCPPTRDAILRIVPAPSTPQK
jgi:glucose/arabinose dehydrogenase